VVIAQEHAQNAWGVDLCSELLTCHAPPLPNPGMVYNYDYNILPQSRALSPDLNKPPRYMHYSSTSTLIASYSGIIPAPVFGDSSSAP
jgi:hypothetical protein